MDGVIIWSTTHIVYNRLALGQYRQTSNINISRNLAGNKLVGHSDVAGTSPVGAAPTTSSF